MSQGKVQTPSSSLRSGKEYSHSTYLLLQTYTIKQYISVALSPNFGDGLLNNSRSWRFPKGPWYWYWGLVRWSGERGEVNGMGCRLSQAQLRMSWRRNLERQTQAMAKRAAHSSLRGALVVHILTDLLWTGCCLPSGWHLCWCWG